MKAEQLNEFNKKDFQDNEAHNLHTENAVEIAKAFGTPEEVEAMERIQDAHMRRGHILPNEIEERNALVRKYYSMLESSVNPTFRSTLEGYKILPPMDKEKYQARDGLEGPFSTLSGKVVYYDPKAGSYYDPDTDMYISYDDFQKLDNDYSDMKEDKKGATPEEEDEFHRELDKLVHKTFGHSSDEKKRKTSLSDVVKEKMDKEEYQAKKKALQDIQMDPHTAKDPELQKELMRRKAELEDEKKKLDELDLFAPNTDYIRAPSGEYFKVNYRNTGTVTGGGHKRGDLASFKNIEPVSQDEIDTLDLDSRLDYADRDGDGVKSKKSNTVHIGHDHQGGTPFSDENISVYAMDTDEYETGVPTGVKTELYKHIQRRSRKGAK